MDFFIFFGELEGVGIFIGPRRLLCFYDGMVLMWFENMYAINCLRAMDETSLQTLECSWIFLKINTSTFLTWKAIVSSRYNSHSTTGTIIKTQKTTNTTSPDETPLVYSLL